MQSTKISNYDLLILFFVKILTFLKAVMDFGIPNLAQQLLIAKAKTTTIWNLI